MTPDMIKAELMRARQAELESDEQLRSLTSLIERAAVPNTGLNAQDCAKLVSAALAVNERLRNRVKYFQSALRSSDSVASSRRVIPQ